MFNGGKALKKIARIFLIFVIVSALCALLCCCYFFNDINVTYVYNNGQENYTAPYLGVDKPQDPVREGYIFVGWCSDEDLTSFYDFSVRPKSDITLYACWMEDYLALANKVSEKAILANVRVDADFYNSAFSLTPEKHSQGSGIIYKESGGFYYILSNYHVVKNEKSYARVNYSVFDAYGNEYSADLLFCDENYDLAALKIRKNEEAPLLALDFEYEAPRAGETVITVSSPEGQLNTPLYGEAVAYKSISLEGVKGDKTEVSFEVIWHTAPAKNGSSGSALINSDMKIVGINYAVGSKDNGEFLYCFAIPSVKVKEFLEAYS